MKELDMSPLGGGENVNYLVDHDLTGRALLRVGGDAELKMNFATIITIWDSSSKMAEDWNGVHLKSSIILA
jgi:hypothetical protein